MDNIILKILSFNLEINVLSLFCKLHAMFYDYKVAYNWSVRRMIQFYYIENSLIIVITDIVYFVLTLIHSAHATRREKGADTISLGFRKAIEVRVRNHAHDTLLVAIRTEYSP